MARLQTLLCCSALLFIVASANLPPYKNPGSWLGALADYNSQTQVSDLYLALWDGASGEAYPVLLARNRTFVSFIPTISERVIAVSSTVPYPAQLNLTYISVFKYAPNSAPQLVSECSLPFPYSSFISPFVLNGKVYAMAGNQLFRADGCTLTPLASLPTPYSLFCSLSFAQNHVAFVTSNTLVELWYNPQSDNFTVTSQTIPNELVGVWLWLQEDPITSELYYFSTRQDYNSSFWKGSREKPQGAVTWSKMLYWNHLDPSYFSIDSRYESDFNGPLFCSSDSFGDTACYDVYSENAWQGPKLATAFPPSGSGSSAWPFYDPQCNGSN